MSVVDLPLPVVAPHGVSGIDVEALQHDLAARVDGEVRFAVGARAAYSTDASNYRQIPIGLVVPRTVDAVVDAVAVCRLHGAPVLCRGGGTSLAGEGTNAAVVIDFSKYCDRLLSVDPEAGTCWVEPGIVLDEGHCEVSMACGERVLFPAVRSASPDDVVLADGFSCRTQIVQAETGGRQGVHLAELLAAALNEVSSPPGEWPERTYASRPHTPTPASYTALAAVLGAALVTAGAVVRGVRR